MTEQFYGLVYDLLVTEGEVHHNEYDRRHFIATFMGDNNTMEYRFQGSLGFGGKFWRSNGRHYVTCYPEDETKERLRTIERLNKELTSLEISLKFTR